MSILKLASAGVVLTAASLGISYANGGTFNPIPEPHKHGIEIFGTVGAAASRLVNQDNVALNSTVINTYNTQKETNWDVLAGGGFGFVFPLMDQLSVVKDIQIMVGPAGYYTSFSHIKGIQHPFSNAGDFDTLNYKFGGHTTTVMAESYFSGTLFADKLYTFQPFIMGGIGSAWNTLNNYSEVATDPASSAAPALAVFRNRTRADFSYEVGAGIKRTFYTDTRHNIAYNAALAYRYFNFGNGTLLPSELQTTNDALSVKKLYSHTVLLTLSATIF